MSETKEEQYARQSRNAVVFVAWLAGIIVAITIIVAIALTAMAHHHNPAPQPAIQPCSMVGCGPNA